MLAFLFFADMQDAGADSLDAPLMSEEQIRACRQGNMDIFASYLGSGNPVIMACAYKAEWEPPSTKTGKGILTTYATIARSTLPDFPVGTPIKWINYMEDAGSIPRQTLERWLSPDGKLVYIINPFRKEQEGGQDIASAQDRIVELSYNVNFPITDHGYYNNLRAMLDIPIHPVTPPCVATQTEIEKDSFLQNTAQNLKKNDIVLTAIIYKVVKTDQGTTRYARVIQSLRGDIPVEALIQWSGAANKLPAGSAPKTELYSSCTLVYVLASSKEVKKLPDTPESFAPAGSIFGLASYNLGDNVSYFPMTESDPGRAMKKLLHIEPAKITAESDAARFQPDPGK